MSNFLKLMAASNEGDPTAQYALGILHRHGDGVPESRDIAMDWLRKAAEKGDKQAIMFFEDLRS